MSIKPLRKVIDLLDVFTEDDHNDHVDNWKAQVSIDEELNPDDPDIEQLINQLKSIVSQMRKIVSGDFYYAQDHNLFVDAWNLQTQINDELRDKVEYELAYWKREATKSNAYPSRIFHARTLKYISASVSYNVVKG